MQLKTNSDAVSNMTWQAVMRFSMVVVSALLFGMHYGQSLQPEIGEVCRSFALSGLAFYFSLELVADQRAHRKAATANREADRTLSRRLNREEKMAAIHEADKSREHPAGNVETSFDSNAELAVYLGPRSQPTLSA